MFPVDLAVRDAMEARYMRQFVVESTVCIMKVTDVTGRYAPRYCSHGAEIREMNAEFNSLMAKKCTVNGQDNSTKNRLNLFTASPLSISIVISNPDSPGVYDYNANKQVLDKPERKTVSLEHRKNRSMKHRHSASNHILGLMSMLRTISLTREGAIRRVAKRVREFTSNRRGIKFNLHTGAYDVTLTPLEFFALDCPHGKTISMTGEYAFQEKEPTSQDMNANCVQRD